MPPSTSSGSLTVALLTAAAFAALLLVVIGIARWKKVALPFAPPGLGPTLFWLGVFLVVAVAQELIDLGGEPAPKWDPLTPARIVRGATIVLLAPLAEEVAFRGTMYAVLRKQGLPAWAAVLLPAVAFTLPHVQYFGPGLVWLFADGLVFGLARHHTKSLFVPVLLHTLGNAYAVAERVFG